MKSLQHTTPLGSTVKKNNGIKKEAARFHEEAVHDRLEGRVINGYSILEKIGSGGMASVYLAIDGNSGARVAFKIVDEEGDRNHLNVFMEKEISALRSIDTKSAVAILDDGSFDGRRYLVTEYVEGKLLRDLYQNGGSIPWERTREIIISLCDALQSVHDAGFMHRDVKPANIFVVNGNSVKLIDFGISERIGEVPEREEGIIVGTSTYLAPETVFTRAYDHRVDVYAVGVILYGIVCGTAPFSGPNVADVVMKHLKEEPAPPSQIRPWLKIPKELESLIMRSLRKDPKERFQSMKDMKEGLGACPGWAAAIPLENLGWEAIGGTALTRNLHPA
jgi:serine/threonine-protein kinase